MFGLRGYIWTKFKQILLFMRYITTLNHKKLTTLKLRGRKNEKKRNLLLHIGNYCPLLENIYFE